MYILWFKFLLKCEIVCGNLIVKLKYCYVNISPFPITLSLLVCVDK